MPKQGVPIFERALNLLKIPNFKTYCMKFVFLKTRKFKKHNLLKYYNYAFVEEYQFSPSKHSSSLFFLCSCSGGLRVDREYEGDGKKEFALKAPPIIAYGTAKELPQPLDSDDEDDLVDERVELFIQRFYEEMRMQREESVLQYNEMWTRVAVEEFRLSFFHFGFVNSKFIYFEFVFIFGFPQFST
ncbi:hypothetical protein NE237_014084 [Protea cynaroides]|uniref:Uncharacterized protein n=1 Tax=Protea cynaroides TaxID=273540 RepID=A0A9Q0JZ63_9MAGN|nr:hypothetical protein NE237_014084 [Protea cynaroides]